MRIWLVCCVSLLACCSSEHSGLTPTASNFIPLRNGDFYLYSVDSVVYQQSVATPYHYELRVQVIDSFTDASGSLTWVLQRSKRTAADMEWKSLATWSARLSTYKAVVSEGNIPYVKLISPLSEGSSWNGNEFNALGGSETCPGSTANTCDLYFVADVGKPYATATETFGTTVTVRQSNEVDDPFVSRDERYEIYALGTGLVFKKLLHYDYCQDEDCYGQQIVERGIDYVQTLTSHGHQ